MSDFERALAFTLSWEGGYSLDKDDPGGETKYGISKRAYPNLDIKNLTTKQAAEIYRKDYWTPAGCDALPDKLGMCHFDAAVNHGLHRAQAFLAVADGDPGKYLDARVDFYHQLVAQKPVLGKFLRGWLRRVDGLRSLVARP